MHIVDSFVDPETHLVSRCLAGDDEAWSELYRLHHGILVAAAARHLGRAGRDEDLAEDIVAAVWLALCSDDGHRLRTYDPKRGSLPAYLIALTRQEAWHHLRRSHNDISIEELGINPTGPAMDWFPASLWWEEFMTTLSPREEDFLVKCLSAPVDLPSPSPTPVAARKTKQRLKVKILAYLAPSDWSQGKNLGGHVTKRLSAH
jgi:DNA-directed RNA polymerase specialized sigma24 family protein